MSDILLKCDVLMIQETWFLTSQIGTINQYFSNFNTYGISGMDENTLIIGRRHGGCSFLIKNSLSSSIIYIDLNNKRVCCIAMKTQFGLLYIFNVYLPCDTPNNDFLQDYNNVLSTISTCLDRYKIEYCIIGGDFNTDLSRNTLSLNAFLENENLEYVLKNYQPMYSIHLPAFQIITH